MSITSSTWDPAQYLKFSNERVRPAFDLLAQVPLQTASHVVDLGCGTGNMTGILKQRFPGADVSGLMAPKPCWRRPAPPCRNAASSKAIFPPGPRRSRLT